jgi:putative FmdB family regulatory protein
MAFYDVKCEECNYVFEVEKKMGIPWEEFECQCPECKCTKVKNIIKPVTSIFNGHGFTRTHT